MDIKFAVFQNEMCSGNWLHSSVNVLDTIELHTLKWSRW